jgi:RND family efflux transporter MFP subunit
MFRKMVAVPVLSLAMAGSAAMAQGQPQTSGELRERGKTVPSETRDLALRVMDVVAKVYVKPGDAVKAGDPLIAEDSREEEVNLEILKLEAELIGDLIIQAADKTLANKKVELGRFQEIAKNNAGAKSELERAQLEVDLAELDLKKARQDREKKLLEVKLQEQRIARMQINSPIDGIVQKIDTQEGEVIDPQRPAITVVRNDPLWVEARIPTARAQNLKMGQTLDVYYEGENQPRKAQIIYFDPVADAGVSRQIVRLAMPNPENRPSGMVAFVVVPPGEGAGNGAAAAANTPAASNANASAGTR